MRQIIFVAFAAAVAAGPAAAQPAQGACSTAEHRQFDFWIGDWQVFRTGTDARVGSSRVERLHGGCVIRERWMPAQGEGGSSLNHFDRSEGRWHQQWMDSSNGHVAFDGGLVDGAMVLTGYWKDAEGPGRDGLVRMTYSRGTDGSVRQNGEISSDHGLRWRPFFDFTYRAPPPPAAN